MEIYWYTACSFHDYYRSPRFIVPASSLLIWCRTILGNYNNFSNIKYSPRSSNIFKINFKMTVFLSLLNWITLGIFWKAHIFLFHILISWSIVYLQWKNQKNPAAPSWDPDNPRKYKRSQCWMKESAEKKIPKGRERKGEASGIVSFADKPRPFPLSTKRSDFSDFSR